MKFNLTIGVCYFPLVSLAPVRCGSGSRYFWVMAGDVKVCQLDLTYSTLVSNGVAIDGTRFYSVGDRA